MSPGIFSRFRKGVFGSEIVGVQDVGKVLRFFPESQRPLGPDSVSRRIQIDRRRGTEGYVGVVIDVADRDYFFTSSDLTDVVLVMLDPRTRRRSRLFGSTDCSSPRIPLRV